MLAGHGPAPLGLQVIGFRSWGRAMPCQLGRLTAFFNRLLAGCRDKWSRPPGLPGAMPLRVVPDVPPRKAGIRWIKSRRLGVS